MAYASSCFGPVLAMSNNSKPSTPTSELISNLLPQTMTSHLRMFLLLASEGALRRTQSPLEPRSTKVATLLLFVTPVCCLFTKPFLSVGSRGRGGEQNRSFVSTKCSQSVRKAIANVATQLPPGSPSSQLSYLSSLLDPRVLVALLDPRVLFACHNCQQSQACDPLGVDILISVIAFGPWCLGWRVEWEVGKVDWRVEWKRQ